MPTEHPTRSTGDLVRVWIRRLGALILAAAAVAVFVGMAPETPTSTDAIAEALHDAEVNEASAISAPQQDVVNGWATRDLLAIIAGQADRPTDQRPAAMVMLAVFGLCLGLATAPPGPSRPSTSGEAPAPPATALGAAIPGPAAAPTPVLPEATSTPSSAAARHAVSPPNPWLSGDGDRPT